jgi:Flp pilus assembly protein CpaB
VTAALGLALVAVLLTSFYVTNYKHRVQHSEAQVTVLVASKDIPVDTPGAELSAKWVTKETVARRQVVPGSVTNIEQLRSLIAIAPVFAGEQITTRRFGTPSERGVRAELKGTQRVIGVTGDQYQLLAGTLRAGDHIDVVGGWGRDDNTNVARVFVRDALVLSAPLAPKGTAGLASANDAFAAQLRLSDAESQRLEWMIAHGKDWRIEIRPSSDSANSPRWFETGDTLLKDGAGQR